MAHDNGETRPVAPVTLTWSGFRGFREPTSFTLPRLTLLIGRNNVGKSSAYAPLLMMKQTLDATSSETALLSRGPLIDAGPFRDYVSGHDESREVCLDVAFSGAPSDAITQAETVFRSVNGQAPFLARQRLLSADGQVLMGRSRQAPGQPFVVKSPLLPKQESTGRPFRELSDFRKEIRAEQPEGFLFSGFAGVLIPRSIQSKKDRWAKVQGFYEAGFSLYERQWGFKARMTQFLRDLAYIGPLRSLAQRTYRLAAESPSDVGSTGEHTPEILFRLRDEAAGNSVNEWLVKLGYGRLAFTELSDEYFQMQIEPAPGLLVNIADSGVGLSQVVPLLAQAALLDEDATLIAQQPEIHLNPAQQSVVTDFLISRANDGVRVVIESHSEHVLLRLRRRIAEGTLKADEVAVYFVDSSDGATTMRQISLGEHAELDRGQWPQGFFEDQLEDSFALAVAQATGGEKIAAD
ncbi:DUF3696 domain-containing protein [Microbacterium sp. zg.Y1090]|uniref:AAA family ATPase n=1 Tax=Microbacterium wangruii TaxID=3049073 RepID=UPI00214D6844|nr:MULTISPECIES: DUF3696 domain-containing protein [unclassified Microbacterium]MCR2819057.1 DUF3696 domain-containing protein [Microbacterium sp. zg.Y1090]WIM27360.1 DUF3696 domain-containing protein [Microbacterium sp. zg-Y1090]